ncbi:MAG: nodulation protein NfeD [Pseudomonadales bacterium]
MSYSKPLAAVLAVLCLLAAPALANSPVWLIDIKGAIGPATADHMERGLEYAREADAKLVVLQIDTPGGLDTAMRSMIKTILASPIPIVAYVAPGGARAASAGTYILYACHVAAMAPATNLGAATPIQIGMPSIPKIPEIAGEDGDQQAPPQLEPATAMERKIINDAVAYIEGLASLRGRNAQWAVKAVREGASLPAEQALEMQVIELIANNIDDLMTQLDGRTVLLGDTAITLATAGVEVYHYPIDWRSEFLAVITNPNIAYLLMMAGIYGLIIEFSNPGFGVPGVLGAVCLLLAMYAFQVLPVSYVGLALILLGVALMTAEALAPSFGVLGVGGIVAFVFGSIMLMDTDLPGYQIALPIIASLTLFSGALLIFGVGMIMKARKQAVVTGLHHLVGQTAVVEYAHGDEIMVRLDGELWQVISDTPLQLDDTVSVTAADGVVLQVKKDTGE